MKAFRITTLSLIGIVMLAPLYLLVINSFKSQQDILARPFSFLVPLSWRYIWAAITAPTYNVPREYLVTAAFVVAVGILCLIITIPAAFAIARGTERWHRVVMLILLAGLFVPGQAVVIPEVYVLRGLGLIGTVPGFLIFETTLTIPVSVFLFAGYISSIPRELDESASIDGASRLRILTGVIVPLMRPAIATVVILNAVGVWVDYVNPAIILGPVSGIFTVTTGMYAAMTQFTTNFTEVYPNLLLALVPIFIFFIFTQRHIVGGLTSGALRG